MMHRRRTWAGGMVVAALLICQGSGEPLLAQAPPFAVSAAAGVPSPAPAAVGQQVTVDLTATAYNIPTATDPYTVQGPWWSWSTQDPPPPQPPVVQYAATAGAWGPAPAGSYSLAIAQPDPSSPDATLTVTFNQAGYWRLSPIVTAYLTDSPGPDTWQASAPATVADIAAIAVTFNPSSISIDAPGDIAGVQATIVPADAYQQVSFDTIDYSVATVTASSQPSPVPLTVTGVGTGGTQLVAWAGANMLAMDQVVVRTVQGAEKLPLGSSIPAAAGIQYMVYVPTAAGGILTIIADGPITSITNPKGVPFSNATDVGVGNQGWYTVLLGGTPTAVSATFQQIAKAKTQPWNFYWWSTQGPYIRQPVKGGNGKWNTSAKAGTDDYQTWDAFSAPPVPGQPTVTPGPNGYLETPPAVGDELRDMPNIGFPNLFTTVNSYNKTYTGLTLYTPFADYDAIHGTNARSQAAVYSHSLDKTASNAEWGGHCMGAAIASTLLNVPQPAPGTNYNSDELKGLWAALGNNTNFTADPNSTAQRLSIDNA
jgi:hypothetical protein